MTKNKDEKHILDAMNIITDGWKSTREIRILSATKEYTQNGQTKRTFMKQAFHGYFNSGQKLIEALKGIDADAIYYTLNPVKQELIARANNKIIETKKNPTTSDKDILKREYILIDVDPVRASGIPSNNEQHKKAKNKAIQIGYYLKNQGWNDPLLINSGNGYHIQYRINEDSNDGGLVEQTLKSLANRFDDESIKVDIGVFNPARITRLPGSINRKGDEVPKLGMEHRQAHLELSPPEGLKPTNRDTIKKIIKIEHSTTASAKTTTQKVYPKEKTINFDVEKWFKDVGIKYRNNGQKENYTIYELDVCPYRDDHTSYVKIYNNGQPQFSCFHTANCEANNPEKKSWEQFYNLYGGNWKEDKRKWSLVPLSPKAKSQNKVQEQEPWDEDPTILTLPRPMTMMEDCMPPALWRYSKEVSDKINAPFEFSVISALSCISSCIGRKFHIRPVEHFPIWPNNFSLIVGESSLTKSASMEFALDPIKTKYRQYIKDFKKKKKDFEKDSKERDEIIKVKNKEIIDLEKKKNIEAVDEVFNLQDTYDKIRELKEEIEKLENIQPLEEEYYYVDDVSEAAFVTGLITSPNGILFSVDEANSLFSSFHQSYNESLQTLLLKCWNSNKDHTVMRKEGNKYIPYVSASLLGGIQNKVFSDFMSHSNNVESGFIPRVQLLVFGKEKEGRYTRNKIPLNNNILDEYKDVIHKIIDHKPIFDDVGGIDSIPLRFTDEALEVWEFFHEELINFVKDNDDLSSGLKSHFKKYDYLMPSISMTYHFIEDPLCKNRLVSKENVIRAIKMCEVLATHAYKAYNLSGEYINNKYNTGKAQDTNISKQLAVLHKIYEEVYEGNNNHRLLKKKMKGNKYGDTEQNIKELIEHGWIRINKTNTRSEIVEVNPKYKEIYIEQEIENEEVPILPDFMTLYEEWKKDEEEWKRKMDSI